MKIHYEFVDIKMQMLHVSAGFTAITDHTRPPEQKI